MQALLIIELEVASQSFTGRAGTVVLVQMDIFVFRVLLEARCAVAAS